ncbi:pirin family protein [Kordiimonas marina]|uniref:pirin family protein n=1 Tax=Kordiimonas marina TaxID=2872312 RepID=UPI001FF30C42|nr:pirin family protein [Kordiimonas marina]MCJ9429935.1 pirin family protein [Kordiimonas marina]
MTTRKIARLYPALTIPEGDGVTVHRSIGLKGLMNLDPFLLLDEMDMPAGAPGSFGFPEHPHRGFETVTYMLSGRMEHGDTAGNKGEIGPGDAQWMTAGRGIVHSEMPTTKGEAIRGFQLWVNLPSAKKMIAPRYQDVMADTIPTVEGEGYTARLVAGVLAGQEGPVTDIAVRPLFADVTLTGGGPATLPVTPGHTVFLYGIEGTLTVAGQAVPPRTLIILTDGDTVEVAGEEDSRFLMVAGAPIGEPVARYGPFVMTTREEIMATLDDWNRGTFLTQA